MSETAEAVKPKSRDEEERERIESRFGGEIRENFDSIVNSLKRLGTIKERGVKEPPYVVYTMTGQDSPVDLNDLPSPFNVSGLTEQRVLAKPNGQKVTIKFDNPDPANNYLEIVWKNGDDYEEHMAIHGSRPKNDGLKPDLFWSLTGKDSRGGKVDMAKSFDGKLSQWGKEPRLFSLNDVQSGNVRLKTLSEALAAKAQQAPNPNRIARLFGR
jgi:hypothetical protein